MWSQTRMEKFFNFPFLTAKTLSYHPNIWVIFIPHKVVLSGSRVQTGRRGFTITKIQCANIVASVFPLWSGF